MEETLGKMEILEADKNSTAVWKMVNGKGEVEIEIEGHLGVGVIFTKEQAQVMIGPCITLEELKTACVLIMYSVLKTFNQLGIMDEAEKEMKKAMEKMNDMS